MVAVKYGSHLKVKRMFAIMQPVFAGPYYYPDLKKENFMFVSLSFKKK